MKGHQLFLANQKIKRIVWILVMLLFFSCIGKKANESIANINSYGGFSKKERIKLIIDGEVIFNNTIEKPYFENRRIVYPTLEKNRIKIFFAVDGSDTTFTYKIKKKSYLKLSLSRAYHQFRVDGVDSASYWNNGID
jgi:hypothetical protein